MHVTEPAILFTTTNPRVIPKDQADFSSEIQAELSLGLTRLTAASGAIVFNICIGE